MQVHVPHCIPFSTRDILEIGKNFFPLFLPERPERGDSWNTYDRGANLIGSLARRAGKIDFCPALAALVSPVQNIIFLTAHFYTLLVSIAPTTCTGSRAGSPVSVSYFESFVIPFYPLQHIAESHMASKGIQQKHRNNIL